jgi:hypothetical protein
MKKLKFIVLILIVAVTACKKEQPSCPSASKEPTFYEAYGWVGRNNNSIPYEFVFFSRASFVSLVTLADYNVSGPLITPLEDSGYVYIISADTLFYYQDTIIGEAYRDSCQRTLTYNVKFIQRTKALNQYPGPVSVTAIIGNVSPDYKVTVKKERVKLP